MPDTINPEERTAVAPAAADRPKVGLTMRMLVPSQVVLARAATTACAARWPSAMASAR